MSSQEATPRELSQEQREKQRTTATAKRRFRGAVLEAAQDLLFADVAVAHQKKLEQVVVLFLLTRLRRAGLTCSHNIRLSHTLSILQVTHEGSESTSLTPTTSTTTAGIPRRKLSHRIAARRIVAWTLSSRIPVSEGSRSRFTSVRLPSPFRWRYRRSIRRRLRHES